MRMVKWLPAVVAGFGFSLLATPFAWAQGVVGAPQPWEMGMQRSFGPIKDRIISLHDLVLVIITVITLFVAGLLIWVMYPIQSPSVIRYPAKPATTRLSRSSGR